MEKNNSKIVILLGGYDLEMLTIKEILKNRKDCIVKDKHLNWKNALLSAYSDELKELNNCEIYGIELDEDIAIPDNNNYHRINHHNDEDTLPSSLEQIAEIFGIKLNHEQELIAANDKGYIEAMENLQATKAEIDNIRRRDRKAQGVTEDDEELAQKSIDEKLTKKGSLLIVEALTNKFSAICDRLYPFEKLLIYTDTEWTYYGKGKEQLVEQFKNGIIDKKIFHGGGKNGYIASKDNAFSKEELEEIIEFLKRMNVISYHNFMFPFQWRIKENDNKTFTEQISLNSIIFSNNSNWERVVEQQNEKDKNVLYDEKNYFYAFIHDALYDYGNENSLIRHYERNECKHGDVTYVIKCWNNEKGKSITYKLKVDSINLNLYSTGVGVLSFYLYNENYVDSSDILCINQYGRRVYPPFIGSVQKKPREIIADFIEIEGLHGNDIIYKEDFSLYNNSKPSNTPATFVNDIITEVATNIQIKPVIDDRMFVQCWYKNNKWADKFEGKLGHEFINSSDWYEFVFVDSPKSLSCQDDDMKEDILKKATYRRWRQYGSLYGVSRYSVVFLTNYSCPDFLFNTFESIYARMTELILVQKASVLRFSSEVTNISNMEVRKDFSKKASSLYKEYIRFVNQIHFREISAQDQGIELYQMLYDALNIGEHVVKLDGEIEELYNYVTLQEDRTSNSTMSRLTWIATIAVPLTLMAGIFGMNNSAFGSEDKWWNVVWWQLGISILITVLTILTIIYINKRKEK